MEQVTIERIGDGRIILDGKTYCNEESNRVLTLKERDEYFELKSKAENLPIFGVRRSALKTPIVRQLENKYGGKWVHYPFSGWGCDEPKMLAHYVYEGGYDINGNPMEENKLLSAFKALRVYGNGKNGERFYPERG